MKITSVAAILSLSALFLVIAVSACSPAPAVVAEPVRPVATSAPTAVADPSSDATPPAEPAVPTADPAANPEPSHPVDEDEADVTADWPVFRDEAYGFQFAYPPEWGFMDLPVYDPGAGGPPTTIQRFVILYPQEWEERLKPGGEPDPNVSSYPALSVEITAGTMEAYRREFMELGRSETIEINGFTALYERDTYDDYNMTRYTFQHPINDQLRITLSDPISGFSVRVAENGDVASLIPSVLSTFTFTE